MLRKTYCNHSKLYPPWPTIISLLGMTSLQIDLISNYVIQYNVICTDAHVFTNKSK